MAVDLLESAIRYIRAGWAVVPLHGAWRGVCRCYRHDRCAEPGRHPFARLAPHGARSATTDIQQVEQWVRKYPQINLAAVVPQHHVVLNIDGADAIDRLESINRQFGLSMEPSVFTPHGIHVYLHGHWQALPLDGIDGVEWILPGRYVIVPPSVAGGVYAFGPGWVQSLSLHVAHEPDGACDSAASAASPHQDGLRPGDWFNACMTDRKVLQMLIRHGWSVEEVQEDRYLLRRPGGTTGRDAVLYRKGRLALCVYSSACGLEQRAYDPFGVYTALEHGGRFQSAAVAVAKEGVDWLGVPAFGYTPRREAARGDGKRRAWSSRGARSSGPGDKGQKLIGGTRKSGSSAPAAPALVEKRS